MKYSTAQRLWKAMFLVPPGVTRRYSYLTAPRFAHFLRICISTLNSHYYLRHTCTLSFRACKPLAGESQSESQSEGTVKKSEPLKPFSRYLLSHSVVSLSLCDLCQSEITEKVFKTIRPVYTLSHCSLTLTLRFVSV
jgi:hypothetical protein